MLIVIPARYDSVRFPGKPLVKMLGKPLIQWTWEAASRVAGAEVVVATDDARIQKVCEAFGANVLLTAKTCRNGTERVAEAVGAMSWHITTDVVVNWQGDAPLIDPDVAVQVATSVFRDTAVATPVVPTLVDPSLEMPAGHVEAWVDPAGRALWFARGTPLGGSVFAHVGMYAYRKDALLEYPKRPMSRIEQTSGLEQLRWLTEDARMQCVPVIGPVPREVNVPADVTVMETVLRARGM